MNSRQRFVLVIAALVVLAMLLFPPWLYVGRSPMSSAGYYFILLPPNGLNRVDTGRLALQLFGVSIVATLLAIAFKSSQRP